MKLLVCTDCFDVVRIPPNGQSRACGCGHSWARYIDNERVHHSGTSLIMGIDNRDFHRGLRETPVLKSTTSSTVFDPVLRGHVTRKDPPRVRPRFDWWIIPEGQRIERQRRS